ncbi:MAG: type II CRISPR RNA-guided endonuclease Cas9 [Oscillospiraceae bacterium]|nr:type II CRISPR RNA-guided endonuclease Cas9 [Oscillospiraceae bacterium]
MKNVKDYYIGLDIGTDSVGWAVTDADYHIMKFNGNAMWGVRMLEESKTADERRTFRGGRRRTERNKFRLSCLEMLFDKEICKKDPAFFMRLKESGYCSEDKNVDGIFSIFNDKDFTDKDYHKRYPTVYHLRKELIESKEPHDVRLVYLAIAHIIKNRGHFFFDSDSLGENGLPDFHDIWNELTVYLSDNEYGELHCQNCGEVEAVLKDRLLSKTKKTEKLSSLLGVEKKNNKQLYSVLALMCGCSVNSCDVFSDESLKESEAKKITFSSGYDENESKYMSAFGDGFELIERLKAIYDWALLADVLDGCSYLSFAKCRLYERHRSDLKELKAYVEAYLPEKKQLIFSENKSGVYNYTAYSGHTSKGRVEKKCTQEDFLDFLKKQLPKEPADSKYEEMYRHIYELSDFMPKIVSKDNSIIPVQLAKAELSAILKNAEGYLPFLSEVSDGKTVSEKIKDILSFRIPYYVGPLNRHSDKSWVVRTDEKIYPWNFEKVVDIDKSAEKFIENLTSKCTYLFGEDVLAKNSPTYCKFTVLNELNNLRLDGEPVSVELKNRIYADLFEKRAKVTQKALKNYLKAMGFGEAEVSGTDGDFKSSLKPVIELKGFALTEAEKEEAVRLITIFSDDRKLLKKRLTALYSDKLSAEDIDRLSKLRYTGWGRLSMKFLNSLIGADKQTGEADTIIGFMQSTNNNLMQLLSGRYSFLEEIQKENGENTFSGLKQEVEQLYVSPKIKRPIYQSMLIVGEIVRITGREPSKIFVEMTRGADEKKERKESRKNRLLACFNSIKKDNRELYESLVNTDEQEFRRDALYLYYTQMGKCMYTGDPINVEDIFNRNLYDIDHIYPQSKIKDDSLNNRVLVKKVINEKKGNTYPISEDIRKNMHSFWRSLKDTGLINDEKYQRLIRNTPLTDDELSGFIARQIVETGQSTKAVAELLKKRYDSKIVYVKAGLVSDFRHQYDFLKCREVNDFHHAKDAYLNIVVGNVYYTKFTSRFFISQLQAGEASVNAVFNYDVEGAWTARDNKSMETVRSTMRKNNIRFTRYSSKQTGGLFDQNILKKGKGQVPIKGSGPLSNIDKYGGYNRAASTYFSFVEYVDEKGKKYRSFEPIDLYIESNYRKDPEGFIKAKLNARSVRILIPCVKYSALISVDGFRMHISSKSGGGKTVVCKPAMQLILSYEYEKYIKRISEYLRKCAELRTEKPVTEFDRISYDENIALYSALIEKLENTIFNVKFAEVLRIMKNGQSKFEKLSLHDQCYVLMQILNIIHANVSTGDLRLIGGSGKSGTTLISNRLQPKYKSFKLIHQSVTGLFEQEIDLINMK